MNFNISPKNGIGFDLETYEKRGEIEREKADEEECLNQLRKAMEMESKFRNLSGESRDFLRAFFDTNNNPRQLWVDDEYIRQLESRYIIEKDKSSPVTTHSANIKMCDYKIQPEVWDYLQNHQYLITSSLSWDNQI